MVLLKLLCEVVVICGSRALPPELNSMEYRKTNPRPPIFYFTFSTLCHENTKLSFHHITISSYSKKKKRKKIQLQRFLQSPTSNPTLQGPRLSNADLDQRIAFRDNTTVQLQYSLTPDSADALALALP